MSIMETATLDMSAILLQAYELGDRINGSEEMADYLYWKQQVKEDRRAQELISLFARKKERFEECERFGHFHPEYHKAKEEAEALRGMMEECEPLRRYQEAEERLDDLLYTISKTIAHAVSSDIKVPSNKLQPEGGCASGSCSTGGSCGGGCG